MGWLAGFERERDSEFPWNSSRIVRKGRQQVGRGATAPEAGGVGDSALQAM
jgi:hypothetical protein